METQKIILDDYEHSIIIPKRSEFEKSIEFHYGWSNMKENKYIKKILVVLYERKKLNLNSKIRDILTELDFFWVISLKRRMQ